MSETPTTTETTKKAPKAPLTGAELTKKRALRRRLRKAGREKLALKLVSDKEFKKTYFEARSKRSTDKKSAFRKKKSKKK
ncbi:MAG: hypothetical protein ACXVCH_18320 [Bdellovibrionota bacterium]